MRTLCIAILLALGLTIAASVVAPAVAVAQGAGYQVETNDSGEQEGGRSGFWTSRRPAKGGAYRWRLLGIGVGLLALTGTGMLVLIRRARAERARSAIVLGSSTLPDRTRR